MKHVICALVFLYVLVSGIGASAQNLSLSEYVKRLKRSQSTGGSETAFMTIGSDFIYGQDYFEAGNYSAAAGYFQAILRKEKDHPYANYQLAVSFLKQNNPEKAKLADEYLQAAFRRIPSLKNEFQKNYGSSLFPAGSGSSKVDQPTERKTVNTSSPASESVVGTEPDAGSAASYGGALHFGKYACHMSVWNGPNTSPAFSQVYQGYFELRKDGTYRWLDNGPVGQYKYDPATGKISWLTGYFQGRAPRSTLYQRGTKSAQITIIFDESLRWEAGSDR